MILYLFTLFVIIIDVSSNATYSSTSSPKQRYNAASNEVTNARPTTEKNVHKGSYGSPTLTKLHHRCRRGNYSTSKWIPSEMVSVPLVPIGWSERWNNESFFLDENAYVYCSNNQGHVLFLIHSLEYIRMA